MMVNRSDAAHVGPPVRDAPQADRVFAGPGAVRTLCRALDWSRTPLGSVERWPDSLLTATAIVLGSGFPMILVWGAELVQLYNDAYIPLIGVKHPRALGTPTHESWPEIRDVQTPIFDRVFRGETVQLTEARYLLDRSGSGALEELFFDASFVPVPSGEQIGGSLSILVESTARVRARDADIARRAADSAHLRLVTAIEHLTDEAVSIIDESGHILYANDTHGRILGYGGDAVGALDVDRFMPDEESRLQLLRIRDEVRQGRSWSGVVRRRRADDGRIVLMDMIIGPIPEDGATLFFAISRDASERLAREQHLRRVERVAGLGTLIAGVAHELNNPLSSILGLSHLLLLEPRSDEERDDLTAIVREAQRMAKIVADLRLVSRDTEERTRREVVELNDVVRHILKTRAYSLSTRNITVEADLADDFPAILGDRAQLEQVVLNLVVNAEQAMMGADAVDRTLIVRTRVMDAGCSIHVIDTGSGIPADHLERIFDPFFTTKRPGEGTGLGLSLAHTIVTEHHGEIHVDSEVGKGTAFRIDLPRTPIGEADIAGDPPPTVAARNLRVLVVDDEESVRHVVGRVLARRGHVVHDAVDGNEALALLRDARDPYDVIVSDLRMPGMGGDELLARLRERGDEMQHRIVFLTGDTASADAMCLLTNAKIPVLVKPIGIAEVVQVVEQLGAMARAHG